MGAGAMPGNRPGLLSEEIFSMGAPGHPGTGFVQQTDRGHHPTDRGGQKLSAVGNYVGYAAVVAARLAAIHDRLCIISETFQKLQQVVIRTIARALSVAPGK